MHLAKGKNGQIGRQVPRPGMQATVSPATAAGRRGQLYLSQGSIESDQAYYAAQAQQEAQAMAQRRAAATRQNSLEQARARQSAQRVQAMQGPARYNHQNELLRKHFARKAQMGETESTVASLLPPNPADFSSSGANPQYVDGDHMTGGEQWRADFRQHLIVGNPLTRDGAFGPGVTDYDRFVWGTDVNQDNIVDTGSDNVVGGTMLGRLNNAQVPMRLTRDANGALRVRRGRAMGDDGDVVYDTGDYLPDVSDTVDNSGSGYDALPDSTVYGSDPGTAPAATSDPSWWDKLFSSTQTQVQQQLPGQAGKALTSALSQGSKVVSAAGGVVTVQKPPVVTTVTASAGLPAWALYAGIGLLGVGLLVTVMKAAK